MKIFKKILGLKEEKKCGKPGTLSHFFIKASSKEKKLVFDRVVRNANKEQLNLVNRCKKICG